MNGLFQQNQISILLKNPPYPFFRFLGRWRVSQSL
jgi:hypothetical protein